MIRLAPLWRRGTKGEDTLALSFEEFRADLLIGLDARIKEIGRDAAIYELAAIWETPTLDWIFSHCILKEGCWMWCGQAHRFGPHKILRPFFTVNGRQRHVHALAKVSQTKRPIPNGMKVCHTCHEQMCVNPVHLELGDAQVNADHNWQHSRARQYEHCSLQGDARRA